MSPPQADAPPQPTTDDDAPPKRGSRRSKPKVKTGCSNCKQRRIKCDERRPACTQCTRSHKDCTGYPAPSRSALPYQEMRIAPKPIALAQALQPAPSRQASPAPAPPAAQPLRRETVLPPRRVNRRLKHAQLAALHTKPPPTPSLSLLQPSLAVPLDQSEAIYFRLFRTHTAAELSGYFDSVFWTRRVLQECHGEPAIRHATVALGALYKTLEQSSEPLQADSVMQHWQIAVKQYSEACNAMVNVQGQTRKSNHTRLMVTVLLACFDSFIGDHKQAIIQIQTGLGLLDQLQSERDPFTSEAHVEAELVALFTRLAIQAKSYDLAFHFPQPYVVRLGTNHRALSPHSETSPSSSTGSPETSPYHFTTVSEARTASDKLNEKMLIFVERLYAAKSEPSNVLPASWRRYGLTFGAKLEAWHDAYEPVLQSRFRPHTPPIEKAAIAALKMFQTTSRIAFTTLFCDTEDQFDALYPHFKTIVDLGAEVVRDDERRAAAERCPNPATCPHRPPRPASATDAFHIRPSFSADLGIVPPLFTVATKCRDRVLRRHAIQLLRSSARREGMWDSELVAHISQWIMELEEAENPYGADFGFGGERGVIPEARRVMVKSVDFDLRARFAELNVGTRGLMHGLPDERARRTTISW